MSRKTPYVKFPLNSRRCGRQYAHARPVDGYRSKTERDYAGELELRKRAGDIRAYYYEPCNWRLGNNCYYRPDFLVIHTDGLVEFVEVKAGNILERARVKFAACAERYPDFLWTIARRKGRSFEHEHANGADE